MLPLLLVVTAACSGTGDPRAGGTFVAPEVTDDWSSGLTIGFVPAGYEFAWNEGHETAVFHVFQTEDGSGQLSVGIQASPEWPFEPSNRISRGEREFDVYEEGARLRVTEEVGDGFRVDVLADQLDLATLLHVAESVTFDPEGASLLGQT